MTTNDFDDTFHIFDFLDIDEVYAVCRLILDEAGMRHLWTPDGGQWRAADLVPTTDEEPVVEFIDCLWARRPLTLALRTRLPLFVLQTLENFLDALVSPVFEAAHQWLDEYGDDEWKEDH